MENIIEIKKIRNELGKILHYYFKKNGEEKYNEFVSTISQNMSAQYGNVFSEENLRIMEAEYVTFNQKINEKARTQD